MAKINDDMCAIVASCGLGYVATVSKDGTPNLSPKGSLDVWDDEHLYFADIASPTTIENLGHNPAIEVNAIDIIKRRGFRFKGTADVVDEGPVFERAAATLKESHGPQYPCNHAVLIAVQEARPVLSPAYVFNDPAPPEEKLSEIWRKKLGLPGAASESDQMSAYEKVLASLLNFESIDELREVFRRRVVLEAVEGFEEALEVTRDRGQLDEFALANAIETALIARVAAGDSNGQKHIETLFNDPDHHQMPSTELTARVTAIWDER
jgi:uncharacterized protein